MDFLRLYLVMGSQDCLAYSPEDTLKQAIEGGITCFQFREKGPGSLGRTSDIWKLGESLRSLCANAQIPFFVNDDVDLALALEANGVHVGQDDEQARRVRERIGGDKWLGVSAHTVEEGKKAVADGADYLGLGPIFPTISKKDIVKQQNPNIFKEFREAGLTLPLVAIGGISSVNTDVVMRAGADGVAIISDICRAERISTHTRMLRQLVDAVVEEKR